MKASTPLAKVVAEALVLGVYGGESLADGRVILFLARAEHGSWSVNGRYNSVSDDLVQRVPMPLPTFRTAMRRLIRAGVVTSIKLGYATTYALTTDFLTRCRTLYEIRFDLQAIECYHKSRDEYSSRPAMSTHHVDDEYSSRHKRALQKSTQKSATANAARPDGRVTEPTQEGTPMERNIDWDDDKPKRPKKGTVWGGSAEVVLGADTTAPMAPRMIKHSPPRRKDVLAVKEYFQSKLLAFSEARHVPLWERVGKMHNNIDFLLKQGHTQAILERAIDYYASRVAGMVFQGESLWDRFFATRDEALRLGTIAAIGSRGGPQESLEARGRRLSKISQQKDDQS